MASIGRFAIAGASAIQDNTLALASINFDFSLIKMEAPLEYHGLGTGLSAKRKREAEEGSVHITARKLGALFVDDLPQTPNLARAYGLRVSEIAESPKFNPKGGPSDGPFAEHVGADGTSIWAAATSGPGAMAVHLLACLLARIWTAPEAISIWSEIVAMKKQKMQSQMQEQHFHIGLATTSQVEVARNKLSEWDASARSPEQWLQIADAAMRTRQTQLMLILRNMDLPISGKSTVYQDVISAWRNALILLENLTSGTAQNLQSGEALLGLCAWHLYPDICAVGQKTTFVRQKDPLVAAGGLATIGLLFDQRHDSDGIWWSMPLAHLRYYGKPVVSHGRLDSAPTRAPFFRLVQVAMGSLMSSTGLHDLNMLCDFLVACAEATQSGQRADYAKIAWPALFGRQAKLYVECHGSEHDEMTRYIRLGQRRFRYFLCISADHLRGALFGLSDPAVYLGLTKACERVDILRNMAEALSGQARFDNAIIRVVHEHGSAESRFVEFATIRPTWHAPAQRAFHHRWFVLSSDFYLKASQAAVQRSVEVMNTKGEVCSFLAAQAVFIRPKQFDQFYNIGTEELSWSSVVDPDYVEYQQSIKPTMREAVPWVDQFFLARSKLIGSHVDVLLQNYSRVWLNLVFGDMVSAAIFQPRDQSILMTRELPIEQITAGLREGHFEPDELLSYLDTDHGPGTENKSLMALAYAQRIYEGMPQAEVDLSVASRTISLAKWVPNMDTRIRDRKTSLACVAMFDTSSLDLNPDDLENVIAISSASNMYAIEALFRDPLSPIGDHVLRHVVGNLGKSGLSLLLVPEDTIFRDPDLDTWRLVNHADFDGKLENNFASTSLHLSLTGYEQPLNTRNHGGRDTEASYVEVVLSAHDHGDWVADINVLRLLERSSGRIVRLGPDCGHNSDDKSKRNWFAPLTSIDNWYEYLDHPENTAIVRAQGNWIARLAFAAIGHPKKGRLIVCSDEVCWACVHHAMNRLPDLHDIMNSSSKFGSNMNSILC